MVGTPVFRLARRTRVTQDIVVAFLETEKVYTNVLYAIGTFVLLEVK